MRYRALHWIYAALNGYFWLPCPICGQRFGGHEWKDCDGKPSSIAAPGYLGREGARVAICPDCTRKGRGDPSNIVIWAGPP
jgi:hypothetical protein